MSRDFDELLSAYLDDEVSPEERAVVERRLEQSPELRETLDELSEVGDLIRRLPAPRAPHDLAERVAAAIAPAPLAGFRTSKNAGRLRWSWPLAAGGTVLAAGIAVVLLLPSHRAAQAPELAVHQSRPADSPTDAGEALTTFGASADGMSPAVAMTDVELPGAPVSPQARSLTEYAQALNRKLRPGEVLSTLQSNAGQTQVVRYTVVDTRELAGTVNTIFQNNSFDVVVTETSAPRPESPESGPGARALVYYVEGPPAQVGRTLNDLESLAVDSEDLGLLAEADVEGAPLSYGLFESGTRNFRRPVSGDESSLTLTPSPAAAAASPLSGDRVDAPAATPPSPAPSGSVATSGIGTESKSGEKPPAGRTEAASSESGREVTAEAAPPARVEAPRGPMGRDRQPSSNANRGVSAQLDARAYPVVENMLGERALNRSTKNNLFRRNESGELKGSPASVSPRFIEKGLLPKSAVPDASEAERLNELRDAKWLDDPKSAAAPEPAGSPVPASAAAVANPRIVPSQEEHLRQVLIILEPGPPQPASPPSTEKKGD